MKQELHHVKQISPAHVSVQGYLKKAAQGKYDEALAIIKKENTIYQQFVDVFVLKKINVKVNVLEELKLNQ